MRDIAKRELARRELARRSLIDFAWYTFRQYERARVHGALAAKLEQVERYIATGGREGIGRLMVFMPPRHGKSELVSVRFPAWFLGRNPDCQVILTSCTADLAVSFARRVRNIVMDGPFQNVFGARSGRPVNKAVMVAEDSRAANAWTLARQRGGLVAAGVGGAIIGRGAHLAVIDDPFRDRKDAESESVRDGVDDWYRSTLYTRLEKGGAVVLMHQRWHSDDLAGRLLRRMVETNQQTGGQVDRWEVLCLPAVAEDWADEVEAEDVIRALEDGWWQGVDALVRQPGEALWPGKYGLERLSAIERNIGGYEWDALYQQRPRRLEGALIKAYDIIQIMERDLPERMQECRYWDLAVSGREGADFIAGARVGRSRDGRLYILDVAKMPGPWADAKGRMIQVMQDDPPEVTQGIEVAGQQAGYFQELQRDARLQGRVIQGVNPTRYGNKEVRANVWASRIPDRLVYLVRGGEWVDGFLSEALAFPRGAHDDQVDAVSGAVAMMWRPGVLEYEGENPFYD